MQYLEQSLNDLRGKLYKDFKTIVRMLGDGNGVLSGIELTSFIWGGDDTRESCMFTCDKICLNGNGGLIFWSGNFFLYAGEVDTDDLVFMHDELFCLHEEYLSDPCL